MQRSEYNSRFAISQSAIKDFRFKSPRRWRDIWIDKQQDIDKDEDSFTFGSLVDTILFTPKFIDERFYITDVSKIPTGSIEKIIKSVYESSDITPTKVVEEDELIPVETVSYKYELAPLREQILEACDKHEWNSQWKPDTRINKIIEKGQDYFALLASARGRKIITSEVNFEAVNIVNKLRKDEVVGKYFVDTDKTRNIFQLELFDTYTSDEYYQVPLKCAIDILHIDEENHTLRVCDFKTSYSAHNFIQSIKQFGYCDQLSFYTYMVRNKLKDETFMDQVGLDMRIPWSIEVPINVVIDEHEKLPYIYEYDWKDLAISQDGNASYLYNVYQTHDHASRIRKGWQQVIEEIAWHLQNDKWDYPVEVYKTGKIRVNLINS